MATLDEELGQVEAQLQQCKERLDELVHRLVGDESEAASQRRERLDGLRAKHTEAQSTLAAIKASAHEKTTADVDGTWSAVEARFFGTH